MMSAKLFGRIAVFSASLLIMANAVNAEEIMVKPTGEFAKIDVSLIKSAQSTFQTGTPEEQDKLIAAIKAAPQNYPPPVFYMLSRVLFERGEKDDAAFWFYAGQVRGRYDANRCADVSARQAITILNMNFGEPINHYTMQDLPKLETLVNRVVKFDEETPHNYDQRWINLHGMGAMMSGLDPKEKPKDSLSLPREQWEKIAAETRQNYLNGFHEAMKLVKERKANKEREAGGEQSP